MKNLNFVFRMLAAIAPLSLFAEHHKPDGDGDRKAQEQKQREHQKKKKNAKNEADREGSKDKSGKKVGGEENFGLVLKAL